VIGCSLFVTCVFGAASAGAGSWEGKEATKDGIRHIANPANPIEAPSTFSPKELWRVGGDDEGDDIIFGVLNDIAVDKNGNVYVLDSQLNEVHIYSPGGEYLRSVGRSGEGPGEFRRARALFVTDDGNIAVMQMMPGKIVMLTPEGDAAGNHPVPETDGMMMFFGGDRAGDQIVVGTQMMSQGEGAGFSMETALIRVNPEGKQTAKYWEHSETVDMNNMAFDERKMGGMPFWGAGSNGSVYLCEDFDTYKIQVFNADGTPKHVIEREFELRVRSKEEKEKRGPRIAIRTDGGDVKTTMKKSKTDRTVLAVYPQDNGDVWVLSSRGAFDTEEGEIATFDVFDAEGKFARQLTLKGEGNFDDDGFYFAGDNFFVLLGQSSARDAEMGGNGTEEDDGEEAVPMSVVCYELGNIVQSKK
jgi:hypothetical protein